MGAEAETPRILVVQTAFLGDVVLATPLLAALRERFPQGHLAFLGTPAGSAILRGLPGVDDFLAYDKKGKERGVAGLFRKAAELKSGRYDLAVSAHRSARTAILLALSGIKRRIGFQTSALPRLYPERAPRDPHRHEVERNLALMGPLGGVPDGFEPKLALGPLPPEAPAWITDAGAGRKIGLCPGSIWETKRWPAPHFARLAEILIAQSPTAVYLLGAESDAAAAQAVAAAAPPGVINLAGKTSLSEWVGTMAAMDLVITNDSAPTHIACALSVPVVVIYGPTTPAQGFAPWGNRSKVLEVPGLECRPCGAHGSRRCREGHFLCMEKITPEAVAAAAEALLGEA